MVPTSRSNRSVRKGSPKRTRSQAPWLERRRALQHQRRRALQALAPSRAATMKLACLLVAGAGAFPASGRDNLAPLEEAAAAEAEAYCDVIAAADTADLLKASYESLEDAYDADAHGHATYDCALAMTTSGRRRRRSRRRASI